MQRYLVDEYVEDYQEGLLSRREALKVLAVERGSAAAATVLAACAPVLSAPSSAASRADAEAPATAPSAAAGAVVTVPANDSDLEAGDITFAGEAWNWSATWRGPSAMVPFLRSSYAA